MFKVQCLRIKYFEDFRWLSVVEAEFADPSAPLRERLIIHYQLSIIH